MKKKPKKQTKMSYPVAEIREVDAIKLAQDGVESFIDKTNDKYYTYPDIAYDILDPTTYVESKIYEDTNDNIFLIQWNGTSPVYVKRKMYPR